MSICAGGVICSTVCCSGASGPRMVLIFSAFKVGCVGEVGGSASLANSWNWDDSCLMPGLVNFLLVETFVFILDIWAFVCPHWNIWQSVYFRPWLTGHDSKT